MTTQLALPRPLFRERLIWVDIETTGLSFEADKILEIAIVLTDGDLYEVASQAYTVKHDGLRLNDFHSEAFEMHIASGLLQDLQRAQLSQGQVTARLCTFLHDHEIPKGVCPMAGSSVHFDRAFLRRHMGVLEEFFHYRNIDVSTIKELIRRWAPDHVWRRSLSDLSRPHRALDDARASIAELRHYREVMGL